MAPHAQAVTLQFGKRNWAISELKDILDIQLLHLRCHAPAEPPSRDGKECENSISMWYSLKVRGLLQQLSKSPSDMPNFSIILRQLAHVLCCKSIHGDWDRWETEVFENWKEDLRSCSEREGRYLLERKALQDALRPQRLLVQSTAKEDDAGLAKEAEGAVALVKPLTKSRSVMTMKRDPTLIRNGPKPIIHCIRHAEAGNGSEEDFYNRDPELTEQGQQECTALSRAFDRHDFVTHLIVSPLSRCISTALNTFGPTIQNGIKLTLVPEIQAAGSCLSCIGLPPTELREKYSVEKYGDIFNFDWVHDGWTVKLKGTYACDEQSVYRRVKDIFKWCRDGQDTDDGEEGRREIVLVTHSSILAHFGHYWEVPSSGWATFTFDENWQIYEIPESKMRRHAPNPELPEPYSPSGSISSSDTIRASRKTLLKISQIPLAQFSTVKFRPNLVRNTEDDISYSGSSRYPRPTSHHSKPEYSNGAYRPRMAREILENSVLPDGAIVSDEEEEWF